MAQTEFDKLIVLEVPIYDIEYLGGYMLVAGAGGGKKYGVRNYFMSFKVASNKIAKEPSGKVEYSTEIPYYIKGIPKNNTAVVCLSDSIIMYSLDINSGQLTELNKVKLLEFSSPDLYLTMFNFDDTYTYAACGNTDGLIKVYQVKNNTQLNVDLSPLTSKAIHFDKVNDIQIIAKRNFLITASMDCTCKISEIKTLKVLRELTFKPTLKEKNFIMRAAEYNHSSGFITTLQSPMRGESYVTKWSTSDFSPTCTKKVSYNSCISMKRIGKNFIIGETSGNVIHVDSGSLRVNSDKNFHQLATKSITGISKSHFFTSSPDQMITVHEVQNSPLIDFFFVLKSLILSFVVYLFVLRFKQLEDTNIV